MAKLLLVLVIVMSVSACKLHVIALKGGEVQSVGSGTCLEQSNCVHNVSGTSYNESFTASPAAGYQFVKWYGGSDDFFCGNSTNPTCVVNLTGLAGLVPDAVIAALGDGYLMPVFSDNVPISSADILLVDGREWAQVDLFTDLSWNDIAAVCSENTGVCSGSLNGWDMTGWTWAHLQDVNPLFNVYLFPVVLGPFSPDFYAENDSLWGPAFFSAGWRPTVDFSGGGAIRGWTRIAADPLTAFVGYLENTEITDIAATDLMTSKTASFPTRGAWFYRAP